MHEREKVLVVVDDNQVRIHNSDGVDVVCIVDGENIDLPDDWTGALPHQATHLIPITVHMSELFDDSSDKEHHDVVLEPGIFVDEEDTQVSYRPPGRGATKMKAPYCSDCDGNHPIGECPGKTDGYVERGMSEMLDIEKPCSLCGKHHATGDCPNRKVLYCLCCKAAVGTKHAPTCSNQNPLVEGGDIVR